MYTQQTIDTLHNITKQQKMIPAK